MKVQKYSKNLADEHYRTLQRCHLKNDIEKNIALRKSMQRLVSDLLQTERKWKKELAGI